MTDLKPTAPDDLPDIALDILKRLGDRPEAREIVLGGGIALKHYLNARPTQDIDAWWRTGVRQETLTTVEAVVRDVARERELEVKKRAFGDVTSYDFVDKSQQPARKVFSVQLAVRDVELEDPVPSPWGMLPIETLTDNLASKMNALVDRGAPRDFVDVRLAVAAGFASVGELWALFQKKRPDAELAEARLSVLHHLEGIERRVPLQSIEDPAERARIAADRHWYRYTLVGAPRIDGPRL